MHIKEGETEMTIRKKPLMAFGMFCVLIFVLLVIRALLLNNRRNYQSMVTHACTEMVGPAFHHARELTLEERSNFLQACIKNVLKAEEPCIREYDLGTDSEVQCTNRYVVPALQEVREGLIEMELHPTGAKEEHVPTTE